MKIYCVGKKHFSAKNHFFSQKIFFGHKIFGPKNVLAMQLIIVKNGQSNIIAPWKENS